MFLALHNHILENGFVANLPGMLHALTNGKVLNPDAAAVLGMPEGTLKSRLIAAKRALLAAAEPLLPASS